jgi:site-specific DNA recombinase
MLLPPDIHSSLYARVSSGRPAQESSIDGQFAADSCVMPEEFCFIDDGCSGATLVRPALERLRDQVASGAINRLYVYSPDRLSRNFAHQAVLVEEFRQVGVEVIFLNRGFGHNLEDEWRAFMTI